MSFAPKSNDGIEFSRMPILATDGVDIFDAIESVGDAVENGAQLHEEQWPNSVATSHRIAGNDGSFRFTPRRMIDQNISMSPSALIKRLARLSGFVGGFS